MLGVSHVERAFVSSEEIIQFRAEETLEKDGTACFPGWEYIESTFCSSKENAICVRLSLK